MPPSSPGGDPIQFLQTRSWSVNFENQYCIISGHYYISGSNYCISLFPPEVNMNICLVVLLNSKPTKVSQLINVEVVAQLALKKGKDTLSNATNITVFSITCGVLLLGVRILFRYRQHWIISNKVFVQALTLAITTGTFYIYQLRITPFQFI